MWNRPNRARAGCWARLFAASGATAAIALGLGCKPEQPPKQEGGEVVESPASARLSESATLEQALDFPDTLQRVARVAQILDGAKASQLPSIRAAFESAPLPWGDLEYVLFVTWWARFDPNEALGYCFAELRTRHPRAAAAVFRAWAQMDPQAVLDSGWLHGIGTDMAGLNPEFVDPVVVGWFESGKPGLDEFIQSLGVNSAQSSAINAYMRMRILRDGARPALEWSLSAPLTPDLQRLLLASGLNIVARREPQLAIEWMAIAEKQGFDVRTFVARIGRGWATTSPRDAMEWVTKQELAEPTEFFRTVSDITEIWLERDEEGLHEWLKTQLKDGWTDIVRRKAIMHYVMIRTYRVDWSEVISRSSELLDGDARAKTYLWVVQRWKKFEPEAANLWLTENKALLGESIKFIDQIPRDEFKRIEKLLEESKQAPDKTS